MIHDENEVRLSSPEGPERLKAVESLFAPWTRESPDLDGLALASWSDRTGRLKSKGRDFYRSACELSGIVDRPHSCRQPVADLRVTPLKLYRRQPVGGTIPADRVVKHLVAV